MHSSTFLYGSFINALLSFLIIAAVVYYLIVAPMAKDHGPVPEGSRSHHAGLPRVPQHDPDRGDAVHVLHLSGEPRSANQQNANGPLAGPDSRASADGPSSRNGQQRIASPAQGLRGAGVAPRR